MGLQATGYRLQAAGCRLQATGYRLQATGYRLQATGYRLQAAGYRLQTNVQQLWFRPSIKRPIHPYRVGASGNDGDIIPNRLPIAIDAVAVSSTTLPCATSVGD